MIYKITKFVFFIPDFFYPLVRSLSADCHPLAITITCKIVSFDKLYHLMFTIYFLFLYQY